MSKRIYKTSENPPTYDTAVKPVHIRADLHSEFKKFCVLRSKKMGIEAESAITRWIQMEGK